MEFPQHSDDDNVPDKAATDQFDEVVSGDMGTERQMDPELERLFEAVARAESKINEPDITEEDTQKILVNLNVNLRQLGLMMNMGLVTGHLRPTEFVAEQEFDLEEEIDEVMPGLALDLRGQYFPFESMPLVATSFDIEESHHKKADGIKGFTYKHIVLGFSKNEDYADTTPWFIAYPGDITMIELPFSSKSGNERELRKLLPDAMNHIDQVLGIIKNKKGKKRREVLIMEALDDLAVTVNWAATDGSEYTRPELVEMLEEYITDKIDFDQEEPYKLTIDGPWHFRSYIHEKMTDQFSGKVSARIRQVLLAEEAGTDPLAMTVTYLPLLEIRLPMGDDNAGHTPVEVPIDSIVKLRTTRMRELPFLIDTLVDHSFDNDQRPINAHMVSAEGQEFVDPELLVDSTQATSEDEDEKIDPEAVQKIIDEFNATTSTLEFYELADQRLHDLVTMCREVTGKQYTQDAYKEAVRQINELSAAFGQIYEENEFIIAASGKGVKTVNSTMSVELDPGSTSQKIVLNTPALTEGDITREKFGYFRGVEVRLVYDTTTGLYSCQIYLSMTDLDNPNGSMNVTKNDFTFAHATIERQIQVVLSEDAYLRIPMFDSVRQRTDAYREWAAQGEFNEYPEIVEILKEVQLDMMDESDADIHALPSLTKLNKLGELLTLPRGDEAKEPAMIAKEALSIRACNMLRDIISQNQSIYIEGAMYDSDGDTIDSADNPTSFSLGLNLAVIDIIPESRSIEKREPMIVGFEIVDATGQDQSHIVYVPLSTITKFEF